MHVTKVLYHAPSRPSRGGEIGKRAGRHAQLSDLLRTLGVVVGHQGIEARHQPLDVDVAPRMQASFASPARGSHWASREPCHSRTSLLKSSTSRGAPGNQGAGEPVPWTLASAGVTNGEGGSKQPRTAPANPPPSTAHLAGHAVMRAAARAVVEPASGGRRIMYRIRFHPLETTTGRSSSPASRSSRLTRLTAEPITVKSKRPGMPDIAVHHVAEMEREAEAEGLGAGRPARLRSSMAAIACRAAARAARQAARGPRAGVFRKDDEDRIADELDDLAAVRRHRRADALEIGVEQLDQRIARQRVGQRREVAQVAGADHRANGLAGAAPDSPCRMRAPASWPT